MLGLIELIIATYLQNNEKSPCKIDIYVGPHTFSLAPQRPPNFFIPELPLCSKKGRNKVRWCPRQEASLAPLCSNLNFFGSKWTVMRKLPMILLGLFGAPAVIRRPHSSTPKGIVPPLTSPRYASDSTVTCRAPIQ